MLTNLARSIAALSLMLTASVSAPAWSAGQSAMSPKAKCTNAKHRHAKRVATPQPARGTMVVEKRKLDVQILSFGP